MFNSLINLHDFVLLAERVRSGGARAIAAKLANSRDARVEKTWEHTDTPPTNWWNIPAVERRWNRLITGDPDTDPYDYITGKYLQGKPGLHAVSLGCGGGGRELRWLRAGGIATITGYDISGERIVHANETARREGLADRARYHRADVYDLRLEPGSCDVVIAEGALHHFAPMRAILERVREWLSPSGLLIVNEYCGPSRFQWTDRQIEGVNGLLALLPANYRKRWGSGKTKRRVYRPGRLSMYLNDPSEAAESSAMVPLLREMFQVIESRMYGGTLLQLLFKDIAQNFLDESDQTRALLELCFDAEDAMMRSGEIGSDFGYFVCRR